MSNHSGCLHILWGPKVTGFPKEEAPPGEGLLGALRASKALEQRIAYLQLLGTYLASTVPAGMPVMPWAVAVACVTEAQPQSMLPDRPVATACAAPAAVRMYGFSTMRLAPASGGMFVPLKV